MRLVFILAVLLSSPACFGAIPTLRSGRSLPNGCLVHAMLYAARLDPAIGTAEVVPVVGGGGISHAIAVVTTPDGRRYGRDEDLGVFPLGEFSPQRGFDRARREALAKGRIGSGTDWVGAREAHRSLKEAYDQLTAAGFHSHRVANVIVWRVGDTAYVYSPIRGCAEVRTYSCNFVRIAAAAVTYWAARS